MEVKGFHITTWYQWLFLGIGIFLVLAGCVGLFLLNKFKPKTKRNNTMAIAYGAVSVALSFALSFFKIIELPYGGAVTFASIVPISIYAYVFGVSRGLPTAFVYGILQAIQDPYIVHPAQFVLDYLLAFTFIGFAGILKNITLPAKNKKDNTAGKKRLNPVIALPLGMLIALSGRFISHVVSGAVYFGEYGLDYGMSPWIYSFTYNAVVVWIDAAIAVAATIGILLVPQIKRLLFRTEQKYLRANAAA